MTTTELTTLVTGLWAKVKSHVTTAINGLATKSELANYNPIIEDTRLTATNAITGFAPFSTLTNGQRIVLHSTKYYSGAATFTLNLTLPDNSTTGAKDIKYITPTNSWNNCANTGVSGKIQSGVYYQLYFDSDKDAWLMEQDSHLNITGMTQVEINQGTSTQQRTISPLMLRSNFYLKSEVDDALGDKQDTIDDLADIRSGAGAGATAYQKPSGGIPKTDLASAVQTSLGKADTALQSFTESDPTVPSWAKQPSKPTYTASEVGALPSTTTIPTKTSQLTNDSGFLTSYTETDPTVPSWAKASTKPSYTASEVGALPSTTTIPSKTSQLTNDSGFVAGSKVYYGTCDTAAATDPKVVTVETFPTDGNDKPLVGTLICVKYSYTDTSTSTSPTINVNGTGDARIWVNNAVLSSAKSAYHGYANRYISYMWDGTYWVWFSWGYDSNTTYTNVALGHGYATDTRTSAVAAVTAKLSSYALTVGGIVSVKFTYDVPASATLNVNSKGAKAIYHRGAAITAGVIKAGDTATFIYTTYYHLISIDRDESADLTNYYTKTEVDTALGGKQATLVSGTNVKTINNTSLLGSGDMPISGNEVKYTGTTGNVVTNNTTLNVAIKAIDDAVGNVETLLASI